MNETRERIAAAPLLMEPFPHIIVPDVLPSNVARELLERWPSQDRLQPDYGDIGRFIFPIFDNRTLRHQFGTWRRRFRIRDGYLHRFGSSYGKAIVYSALERFSKFNEAKFSGGVRYWGNLCLLESGPTFAQHAAHTHFNHNPDWVMTFLLFLDDGGREDRGEVFSAPTRGADWLDIVVGAPDRKRTPIHPVKRIPFKPNTLLAWLDGPMSYHGTDKLALDPANRRRMLRCHAGVSEQDLVKSLGVKSVEFLSACEAHRDGRSDLLKAVLERPGNCVEAIPRFSFAD